MSTIYRGGAGQWAFLLHRISGFLVLMFLLLHIVDVSLINIDRELYNQVHALYGNIVLRVFEVGLLAALIFHACNGLRIVAIDFIPKAVTIDHWLLAGVFFVSAVATVAGGYVILFPFFDGRF